jgi:large subunit ribosomal protein L33
MASNVREKIMLESTGLGKNGKPTRYYYTTHKNKRNTTDKIELYKYDPRAYDPATGKYGKHVLFKEKKLPK